MKQIHADKRTKKGEDNTMAKKTNWRDDKIRLKISKGHDVPDPVFVGINGHTFAIKPGVWVTVPKAVVEVLDNSTICTTKYTVNPDNPSQYIKEPEEIDRFAVSTREVKEGD